jgi:hypothetical protein
VATREHELQAFVGEGGLIHRFLLRPVDGLFGSQQVGLCDKRPVAADPVDRPVACGRDEPCPRVRRDAVARPPLGGDGERFLRGLLGEIEVTEEADQRRQDASPLVAEDGLQPVAQLRRSALL